MINLATDRGEKWDRVAGAVDDSFGWDHLTTVFRVVVDVEWLRCVPVAPLERECRIMTGVLGSLTH